MLIPITARSTEQFLQGYRAPCGRLSRAGSKQVADHRHCGGPCRQQGNPHRNHSGVARISGETAPLLFTVSTTSSGVRA